MAEEKILIVDPDTRLLNSMAEQVLSPHGFKPLLAADQDQGVRMAVTEEPQLLLLHLPLDSSVRLLHRLRQGGLVIPSILMVEHESASIDLELLRWACVTMLAAPSQLKPYCRRCTAFWRWATTPRIMSKWLRMWVSSTATSISASGNSTFSWALGAQSVPRLTWPLC